MWAVAGTVSEEWGRAGPLLRLDAPRCVVRRLTRPGEASHAAWPGRASHAAAFVWGPAFAEVVGGPGGAAQSLAVCSVLLSQLRNIHVASRGWPRTSWSQGRHRAAAGEPGRGRRAATAACVVGAASRATPCTRALAARAWPSASACLVPSPRGAMSQPWAAVRLGGGDACLSSCLL